MLHCNGNKLAGPSFPNKSLPIAISMIAANNRKPFSNLRKWVSPSQVA